MKKTMDDIRANRLKNLEKKVQYFAWALGLYFLITFIISLSGLSGSCFEMSCLLQGPAIIFGIIYLIIEFAAVLSLSEISYYGWLFCTIFSFLSLFTGSIIIKCLSLVAIVVCILVLRTITIYERTYNEKDIKN